MPLPLLALAAAAALPQLFKVGQGFSQLNKANKVKVQNTQPAAFTENLNLLRQEAGSQLMPGYGLMRDQLNQGTGNVMAAATRAGGSSSDVLSALGQADQRRQMGIANLNVQNQQYQQQARRSLSAGLLQQAAYQKNDLDTASRTRAAFKQSGNQNIFSGLEGAMNNVAYFGSQSGQDAINGTNSYNPLMGGAYDQTPLGRMSAVRGFA